ncbi:DUF3105 domain-containing protein [Rhodococcus triatomae]|nr:DUF3105 domain-containing protein [Rhodococcus triatomae]QNG25892.1 DUF3105 domain-containing protein [Rhodococcus triatomae]
MTGGGKLLALVALVGVCTFGAACASAIPGRPGAESDDPASIEGITIVDYPLAEHVTADQRVNYRFSPPIGGRHDSVWAQCTGTVYDVPIRSENAVHSLEHGAVWITYDPERLSGSALADLAARVDGSSYLLLSPYPGLEAPLSLQSWGHQLFVDDPEDERVGRFVRTLRQNPDTHPEPGATCSTIPGAFDPQNPPPFVATPPDPTSPDTLPER